MSVLAFALAKSLSIPQAWSTQEQETIAGILLRGITSAKATWNQLSVPDTHFVEYLAERLQCSDTPTTADIVHALCRQSVEDLYLCCACSINAPNAIAEFETVYGTQIAQAVRGKDTSGDLVDEVKQIMRLKLFVPQSGNPPGIHRYMGCGPLGRWIWVMATREALMWHRSRKREAPLVDLHLQIADCDIELDYLKKEYRDVFAIAFSKAITELEKKEQNIMYYHFVQKLTIDQIGGMYRVNRVTAYRWLRKAREVLLAATYKQLSERLQIEASEMETIVRLVESQLEVSVERLLTIRRPILPV